MAEGKNPMFAAVLSLFIAGLGQVYLRKYSRAAVFLALELATSALLAYDEVFGLTLNLLVSLYASFDAYRLASKTNEETPKDIQPPLMHIRFMSKMGEEKPKAEDIPAVFMK